MKYKTTTVVFVVALLAGVFLPSRFGGTKATRADALSGRESRPTTAENVANPLTAAAGENRWYVYSDAAPADGKPENHGYFTNYMAEKDQQGHPKTDMLRVSMVESENPYAGETCIRVEMDFRMAGWGGLVVSSAPDYWAETPGPAFELSKAKKLVFYARGNKGNEMIQAKVAVVGDKPYGDRPTTTFATQFLSLSKEWKRFELPVSGITRLVTPFAFVSNRPSNRDETITFFLDEIYFIMEDGTKTAAAPTPAPVLEKSTFHTYLTTSKPNAALIAYSPSEYDPRPTARKIPSAASVTADLAALRPAFDGLILYGYDRLVTPVILAEAQEQKYRAVVLGIWDVKSDEEIKGTVELIRQYHNSLALALCLGNEGINFNRYRMEDLLAAREKLRQTLKPDERLPIGTSEPLGQYGQESVRGFGDILFPNIHPFFDQPEMAAKAAANWTRERALALAEASGKRVLVKETGFPNGSKEGYNPETQADFWTAYLSGSTLVRPKTNPELFVSYAAGFEAYRLKFKAEESGLPVEAWWGLLDNPSRTPYPAFFVWQKRKLG